jgi:aspartyl-tRNA(Asn)/glutamyl-tRNA(Gln) amidotransferase subunit B
MLQEAQESMGELPAAARIRLQSAHGLSAYDSRVITGQGRIFQSFFEQVAVLSGDPKASCNWMTNSVLAWLNEHGKTVPEFPMDPARLADLIREIQKTGLNMQRSREVFARMLETGNTAAPVMAEMGFQVVADTSKIAELIRKGIAANPKAVADYKNGKVKAADAIKGFVMRETKGMANTELVSQILLEELAKI